MPRDLVEKSTILAPVDFSTNSRAAALRACDLGLVSDQRVRLAHALDLPAIAQRKGIAAPLWNELRESERREFDALCRDLEHRGASLVPYFEEREPVEMITELASEKDVGLVVMGTHGYRGFDRMFLGSVAEKTIRAAVVPVMTVKENEWDAASKIRRILLATDFSPDSENAVTLAMRWARLLEAGVEVFHAIPATETGPVFAGSVATAGPHVSELRDEALRELQSILARFSEAGVPAGADLTYGPASIEIVKRVTQYRANLVVLGRRGQTRLSTAVFGSVAERVLRQVKCSVLIAPGELASDATS